MKRITCPVCYHLARIQEGKSPILEMDWNGKEWHCGFCNATLSGLHAAVLLSAVFDAQDKKTPMKLTDNWMLQHAMGLWENSK